MHYISLEPYFMISAKICTILMAMYLIGIPKLVYLPVVIKICGDIQRPGTELFGWDIGAYISTMWINKSCMDFLRQGRTLILSSIKIMSHGPQPLGPPLLDGKGLDTYERAEITVFWGTGYS